MLREAWPLAHCARQESGPRAPTGVARSGNVGLLRSGIWARWPEREGWGQAGRSVFALRLRHVQRLGASYYALRERHNEGLDLPPAAPPETPLDRHQELVEPFVLRSGARGREVMFLEHAERLPQIHPAPPNPILARDNPPARPETPSTVRPQSTLHGANYTARRPNPPPHRPCAPSPRPPPGRTFIACTIASYASTSSFRSI